MSRKLTKINNDDIQSNDAKYDQVNCMVFLYASINMKVLTVSGNQIRSNKRNTLFDIEGLTEVKIREGAKEFFTNYYNIEKKLEETGNKTLTSRNLMNSFMINYFNIDKKFLKLTEKGKYAKNSIFTLIKMNDYLKDIHGIDYEKFKQNMNELIGIKYKYRIEKRDIKFYCGEIDNVVNSSKTGNISQDTTFNINRNINDGINQTTNIGFNQTLNSKNNQPLNNRFGGTLNISQDNDKIIDSYHLHSSENLLKIYEQLLSESKKKINK